MSEARLRAWVKALDRPLEPLSSQRLEDVPADAWVWIDVTAPTVELAVELGERFDLPGVAVEDAVDRDLYPKWEDHGASLLAVFHLPIGEDQRVATAPLVCIAGARFLLTFHAAEHSALEWLITVATGEAGVVEGGPDRMLARVAELCAREFHPLIEGFEVAFDSLEDRALEAEAEVLADTQALRRDAGVLRSVLGTEREVLRGLSGHDTPLLTTESRARLRDSYDRHHRHVEELDAARMMLSTVVDTYRGVVAERTNDVMKVLTVFAAIVMPLTLIAGIYGMNFEHMPELGHRWAYPAVLTLMATIAIGLWISFARRGYIGSPSVARLPHGVGRGLHHLVAAPSRTLGALATRVPSGTRAPSAPQEADLDRETLEVVADLFRLGWHTPHTLLDAREER